MASDMSGPGPADESSDTLGGPDPAGDEDELGGRGLADTRDDLSGPDPAGREDELGGA
jgi:hypothetical protein